MTPTVELKKKTNPSLTFSFLLLPNEIIVDCFARISRSYYPKLSLVCKTFRSLILSMELTTARFHLRTHETVLNVCLQLSNDLPPSWFSLWIKPDQTLTNNIGKKQKLTGKTLLVRTPSTYYPRVPLLVVSVGSDYYALAQNNAPSPVLWVLDKHAWLWRKGPNMTVARERAAACVLDGKIYVMGGCGADKSANRAEVFDPKTQTWEPLPDPGAQICFSKIKKIEVAIGKLFIRCNDKDYVFDPKRGKWGLAAKGFVCMIDKVFYRCDNKRFLWYDTKRREWRDVRGLATLNRYRGGDFVDIVNHNGKLLVLWDKFGSQGRYCQHKNIWCAAIAFERRNDDGDEIWGIIEWVSVVLTVPSSYVFLRCRVSTLI